MKRLIFILLISTFWLSSEGQRDALYFQYLFNLHTMNPAYSGHKDKFVASLVNRNQWVGIPGAPHTVTLSCHSPTQNEILGVGGYVYMDHLGPLTNWGVISTYAYRLQLYQGRLSFGLSFGFKQRVIDWDKLFMERMDDFILLTRPRQKVIPDANFGIFYNTDKWFISFSSKHLFDRVFEEWGYVESDNFSEFSRHFYTYFGGFFQLNNKWLYKPSAMIKYVDNGDLSFDLNSELKYKELFWVGISYRTNYIKSITLLGEIRLNSKLKFGYSYDTYLGDVGAYNIGSHEVVITYEFEVLKEKFLDPCEFW